MNTNARKEEVPRFLYWLAPLVAVASVLLLAGVSPVLVGAAAVSGWIVWTAFDNGRALRHPLAILFALLWALAFTGFIVIAWVIMAAVIAA